ncbi:hypothetical protein [Patulibacter medicamentivorans]|jgi:hypothetical protein|uniref:hypothetical protein n=1 Tax=Patulibacter medicamentivorans TaxID=1097667 RepID=UPI00058EBFE9|nr:hypothetical protein [Patulibacter medicamentivorans]
MEGHGAREVRRRSTRETTTFRWINLSADAATRLGEPVLAATPVSPVPRRAPGFGSWGHEPLTGAEVRYLVVTATRVVVYSLDRGRRGEPYYRLLRVEIERPRTAVAGVALGRPLLARAFEVHLTDGSRWPLEVSPGRSRQWGPVVDLLGRVTSDAGQPSVADAALSQDSTA